MKFRNALLIFVLSFTTFNLFAQTSADTIVGNYFKAIGGRDKVAAINTVTINGTMEMMGHSSTNKVTVVNGKGYKSEMGFNGQNVVQSITDSSGWMINPFMGSSTATAIPAEQYNAVKDEIYIGGGLFNYMNNGSAVKYLGMENVDGKSAKKIEVSKDSITTVYYIDSSTNLLDEKTVMAAGQTTTAKYSNYKQTEVGVMMAYNEEITLPQGITINYTIDKIEYNKPVDPSIFDFPKQ